MSAVSPHSHSWHWSGKRPWKQAVSSGSCSLPLGSGWGGEARHGLRRPGSTECAQYQAEARLWAKPEGGQSSSCACDTICISLVDAHLHVALLAGSLASHPRGVFATQLLLPRECWEGGSNGFRLLILSWNGIWGWIPVHSSAQPTDTVATLLQAFSCSHHPCLPAVQLCSFPWKRNKKMEKLPT